MHSKVPLEGDELEEHLTRERAAKEREAAAQGALARSQRLLEADEGGDDGSSDGSDDDSDADERDADADAMKIDDPGAGGGMDWSMLDTAEDSQTRAQQLSFDIYLKGNTVARTATSFFKSGAADASSAAEVATDGDATTNENTSAPSEGLTRYRMFPMIERRRRVDAYGETLDVGAWMRRGKALEEEAKGANGASELASPEAETEATVSPWHLRTAYRPFTQTLILHSRSPMPRFHLNSSQTPLKFRFYVKRFTSIWRASTTGVRSRLSCHK